MAIFRKSTISAETDKSEKRDPIFLDIHGPGEVTKAERLTRWVVVGIAVVLAVWLSWLLAASFVPRWWAQHIGQRVDGSFSAGAAWGFGYGFFATFLSLLILAQIRRKFLNWWGRLSFVLLAVAVSAPSLMTLGVTIGSGKSSHAGRRIFDVNAPGFQWATLMGVVVAAGAFAFVAFVLWRSRSNKAKVAELAGSGEAVKKDNQATEPSDSADSPK